MSGRDDDNPSDAAGGRGEEVPDPSATVPGTQREHWPGAEPSDFEPYPTAQLYRRELLLRPLLEDIEPADGPHASPVEPRARAQTPSGESWSWAESHPQRVPPPEARHPRRPFLSLRLLTQPVVVGALAALTAVILLALLTVAIILLL